MDEFVDPWSVDHIFYLGLLIFSRGMDLLSTWVATPNLALEGNPIAKKLGWKWGVILNLFLCAGFSLWPFSAIIIGTTSVLVAARNFQSAWLMRTMGEEGYRDWYVEKFLEARRSLYFFCLLGQTFLVSVVGVALLYFSRDYVSFAIGMGVVTYTVTVLFYSLLAAWRLRTRE